MVFFSRALGARIHTNLGSYQGINSPAANIEVDKVHTVLEPRAKDTDVKSKCSNE